MRYVVFVCSLVLIGAGCVEGMMQSSNEVFLDVGIDGMDVLMDEAPGLMDDVLDEYALDSFAQTNGVWTYMGNMLSTESIAFTTLFDTYIDLEPTADSNVIRVQNYDLLLDQVLEGEYFLWVDVDAVEDSGFFEGSYDQLKDVTLGERTWVMGTNSLEEVERPVRGYRYETDSEHFEIIVYPFDQSGLERAQDFVETLEFLD